MLAFKQIYGIDGYNAAKALRQEVFMDEQGFNVDYDEHDDKAWHIVGYDGDLLIGTARVYKLTDTTYKIGRVAVKKSYRGGYVGDLMMKTLQDKIVTLGGIEAVVSSQLSAKGFYEYEGYELVGDVYIEEGAKHVLMKLDLTRPHRSCNCKKEN
ncbi:MAG: GNAT family N-acetyltransferase [Clostridia bacterium]|nr:GNAT family N-acetyltransferase [Clostridia bacterium]MBQ8637387.1 GNAT family N-acetyltransferase [Clostridia bacterium]